MQLPLDNTGRPAGPLAADTLSLPRPQRVLGTLRAAVAELGRAVEGARRSTQATDRSAGLTSGRPSPRGPATATPTAPRFALAITAILRNEAVYLDEWIAYHLALGVRHFFLYDNESDDDLRTVIRRYQAHGIVTLIDWPGRARQRDAYLHAVRLFGPSCDWMAFIDLDEFIVPQQDPDIPTFLDRFSGADQVLLPMREFAFNGHRTRPDRLVMEAYTTAHVRVPRHGDDAIVRVKSIVRPGAVTKARVHSAQTRSARTVDVLGRPVPETNALREAGPAVFAMAQLNHYYTKSFEEFERKRERGSATGRITRPPVPFDLPDGVEDRSALRFEAATREMLATLRALDPDPYRYGSRLALDVPRPHPFALEASVALGNHVAGLAEPRAAAAIRVPTLPDEHGVVLRTDMTSHVLQPGELSGSVHLAVQIDRLRARVAWDLAAGGARPERIDAGAPGGLGLISQRVLSIPTGEGDRLRCQAIVLGAVVDGPSVVHLVADGTEHAGGDGHTITRRYAIELASAGSYMAMVTIDPDPAFVRRVRVELPGEPRRIDLTDLLVLTYA